MRFTRLQAAIAALALSLASAPAAAQVPPSGPPARPEVIEKPRPADPELIELGRGYRHRHPVIRVAQDYRLPAGETVPEVHIVFGDAYIDGEVESDVIVVLGSLRIGPKAVIDGSVGVIGGSATIDGGARVGQDLVVVGGTLNAPAEFSPGSYQVVVGSRWAGAILDDVAPWFTRGMMWGRLIVPDMEWIWAIVGVFFLIYLALNTLFDRAVGACADALMERPLSMFLAGMLMLILTLPILTIVAATVIGIALIPFIICALIVAGLVGKTAIARAIGRSLIGSSAPETRAHGTLAFILGFALLTLAYMVPILGLVTWALTAVMGFGAATATFRGKLRRERPAAAPKPGAAEGPAIAPPVAPPLAPPIPAAMPASASIVEPLPLPPPPPPPAVAPPIAAPARPAFANGLAAYPRATFLDRGAAFFLDAVLIAFVMELLDINRYDQGLFVMALLGYKLFFWAWRSTTLGGIVCNLRVARTDGGPLGPADALIRALGSMLSMAAIGIGYLWMLRDPEGQTWHDKIAGTVVVKVPREVALA